MTWMTASTGTVEQYSTVQYITVPYGTARHGMVWYITVRTVRFGGTQYMNIMDQYLGTKSTALEDR